MQTHTKPRPLFDVTIVRGAPAASLTKVEPRHQVRNPVMFVVLVGSVLTTLLLVQALMGAGEAPAWFIFAISAWLWLTVLFANFAEAMAEGRGKAQADSLRKARRDVNARKLDRAPGNGTFDPNEYVLQGLNLVVGPNVINFTMPAGLTGNSSARFRSSWSGMWSDPGMCRASRSRRVRTSRRSTPPCRRICSCTSAGP